MKEHCIIIIFTKDRPETLRKTLLSIKSLSYSKYVIDDSVSLDNQIKVSALCNNNYNCNYLGIAEFKKFVLKYNIQFPIFDFLLRELGNINWNLGYARNFALLYSKSICADKVLFMDDDIHVYNPYLINDLFTSINDFLFVGANISGLVDDSVLGHIATDLGIFNERMLSGGFMVFKPNKISHFFLNNYNEDWIWLFLHLKGEKYLQKGEVLQELSNPLDNYQDKMVFQELGEIALDGIMNLFKEETNDDLINLLFWKRMISEREDYLDLLSKKAKEQNRMEYIEIIEWTKKGNSSFAAEFFLDLFENYFSQMRFFKSLYNSF